MSAGRRALVLLALAVAAGCGSSSSKRTTPSCIHNSEPDYMLPQAGPRRNV
jgi:ABC-type oligopeptide transport system substrate-binding subunit